VTENIRCLEIRGKRCAAPEVSPAATSSGIPSALGNRPLVTIEPMKVFLLHRPQGS
jgi:hypothetical protein